MIVLLFVFSQKISNQGQHPIDGFFYNFHFIMAIGVNGNIKMVFIDLVDFSDICSKESTKFLQSKKAQNN